MESNIFIGILYVFFPLYLQNAFCNAVVHLHLL